MNIPVILKDGRECAVSKDELQYLMVTQQVMFFERSDGWAVIGRDKVRLQKTLCDKITDESMKSLRTNVGTNGYCDTFKDYFLFSVGYDFFLDS